MNTNHLRDILLRMTKKIWNHNIFKGKEDQSTHNYIWRSFCTLRFAIIYTYKTNVGRSRINRRGRIYIFQNFKMTQIMILLLARLVLFKNFCVTKTSRSEVTQRRKRHIRQKHRIYGGSMEAEFSKKYIVKGNNCRNNLKYGSNWPLLHQTY